jgi:hypothetical protein
MADVGHIWPGSQRSQYGRSTAISGHGVVTANLPLRDSGRRPRRARIRMVGPSTFSRIASARSHERPRPRKVALIAQQQGEGVKRPCRMGMIGAEGLLADRKRTLAEPLRARKVAKLLQRPLESVQYTSEQFQRLLADHDVVCSMMAGTSGKASTLSAGVTASARSLPARM